MPRSQFNVGTILAEEKISATAKRVSEENRKKKLMRDSGIVPGPRVS